MPDITLHKLPQNQFVPTAYTKHQIYVHHTASSADPYGVFKYWAMTQERVSTAFVIAGTPTTAKKWKDGEIIQCFNSKYGGWHLGLKAKHLVKGGKTSTWLNMNSIGIEICNWGFLSYVNGQFLSYTKAVVPETEVIEYPDKFRGQRYYQRYTDSQLEETRKLLRYLCHKWDIDPSFKGKEIFGIDKRPLMGENGIWTHVSVRPDKSDCHPQPELIQMLESL